jgi:hypothetical protein
VAQPGGATKYLVAPVAEAALNRRTATTALISGAVLLVVILIAILARRALLPSFTEEDVRERIFTTIQQEAPASFLVTGTLDIAATTTVENTREVLPDLLDISLGTSKATVQVAGRAFYGFDVRSLKPEHIRVSGDTLIEIDVPAPQVYSVEPNLSDIRVWTERGWARSARSTQHAQRRALALINGALMRQAKTHIEGSVQPQVNTARALKVMLMPAMHSLGMKEPVFRFRIGERIVMER